MNFLFYLLLIINIIWSGYLTFLFYKRGNKSSQELINTKDTVKINITRFNPFNDIGGDQSFILTILDQNKTGAILTSLHSRDITRIYAKSIKNGEGENITLSKEEKLAINKTIKS